MVRGNKMTHVFLVIVNSFDVDAWRVEAVCSTQERAIHLATELTKSQYLTNSGITYLYSVHRWCIDGEEEDCHTVRIEEVAEHHPEVRSEIHKRAAAARGKADSAARERSEEQARRARRDARQALDKEVVSGKLTKEDYLAAVRDLEASWPPFSNF